jgi:D-glycero-alpha-D-manno-heptose 1-phosphate guanylyltransferase
MPINNQSDTVAVLLVGGMGTRLRSVVPNAPKPLAAIGSKSFLELLIRQLHDQDIRQIVMCTGYRAEQIEDHFKDGRDYAVSIGYSRELQPQGTGGAIKLAEVYLQAVPRFIVMNGDSFMEINFADLLNFHESKRAILSMAVRRVPNAGRYGTVELDANQRVTAFREKTGLDQTGIVNAGVYVFNHEVLQVIPQGPSSLEKDVLPKLLDHGVYALEQHGEFIDIGTPEDYARAQQIHDRLYEAASLKSTEVS